MKLALAQMAMDASLEENFHTSLRAIEHASTDGADLIFFPELQLSPFFPQYEKRNADKYLLTLESEYIRGLQSACKDHHIAASPNVYLHKDGQNYDASLFIGANGDIQGISAMVHIMQGENFYEQDYYSPSAEGFMVYETPLGTVGIVICFDRHLPESIRTCVALGADLILIPTANIEGEPFDMFEWEVRVQAMQSSVFVAMCNRVGTEGDLVFGGESIVVDPHGDVLVKADDSEQILSVDIDLASSRRIRDSQPYFRLRRPEFYR